MSFKSIDEIKAEFNLTCENQNDLYKELKKLRVKLHPDNNGGEFLSEEDKEAFTKIGEAIEYIDNNSQNANTMVPISEIKDLIEMVRDLVPHNEKDNLELKLSGQIESSINNSIEKIKSQSRLPKITLSSFSAILTAVWLFPSTISEHPVLKNYIDINSKAFLIAWLYCLISTAGMWIIINSLETREKEFKKRLNVESVQNKLFENFLTSEKWSNSTMDDFSFTKDDFIRFLQEIRSRKPIKFLRYYFNDIELAQSLANLIFARAEQKKIIRKANTISMSVEYVLEDYYLKHF